MKGKLRTLLLCALGMLVLILDTKTAARGALEGVRVCLLTVVPTLLPFFVLSILLTGSLSGAASPLLQPLGKWLRIPKGCEFLFLLGLLGGYPTGAQAVFQAYSNGQLTKSEANRMLAFCSNAGPSFLFGIAATDFRQWWIPWIIWLIHILSAAITAVILPGDSSAKTAISAAKPVSVVEAVDRSVRIMARVCCWIVLFRVLLCFCQRWFLWLLPSEAEVAVTGLLELANGCLQLPQVESTGLRMILCCCFLSFGGLCVIMQTASVIGKLDLSIYLKGKLLQLGITLFLSCIAQYLMLPVNDALDISPLIYLFTAICVVFPAIILRIGKNYGSILKKAGV